MSWKEQVISLCLRPSPWKTILNSMGIPWNSLEFNESPSTSFGIQWKLFETPRTSIGDPVKSFGTHRNPWKDLFRFL